MASVRHQFQSAKSDGADATLVKPSNWNDDHEGNSNFSFMVAANDSSDDHKLFADYLCDGTADEVEIQAAIDALPSRGGEVKLAPGLYNFTDRVEITENKKTIIAGPGARVTLASGISGFIIDQGVSNARGVYLYDIQIHGGNLANTIGVNIQDTNWAGLFGVQIEDTYTGILLHASGSNEFVEGLTLEDIVIRNSHVYGIEFRRTGGTNSFGQHSWRNVNVNVGEGIGVLIPNTVSVYRSRFEMGIWISTDDTGISMDGDFADTVLDLFVEGATGSTGNTAVIIGSNATNLTSMDWHYSIWGTINTNISNSSSRLGMYKSGRRFFGLANAAPIQVQGHGIAGGAQLTLEYAGPSGGRITFGSSAGTTQDVTLFRNGTNQLKTGNVFLATGGIGVGNSAAATTPGSVTDRIEVFDANGASLGFIAVYDAIT